MSVCILSYVVSHYTFLIFICRSVKAVVEICSPLICMTCHRRENYGEPMRSIFRAIRRLAQERSDVKVGKINVDEQGELAARFGVMSIPTLVVIKEGKVAAQSMGAKPKAQILGML